MWLTAGCYMYCASFFFFPARQCFHIPACSRFWKMITSHPSALFNLPGNNRQIAPWPVCVEQQAVGCWHICTKWKLVKSQVFFFWLLNLLIHPRNKRNIVIKQTNKLFSSQDTDMSRLEIYPVIKWKRQADGHWICEEGNTPNLSQSTAPH